MLQNRHTTGEVILEGYISPTLYYNVCEIYPCKITSPVVCLFCTHNTHTHTRTHTHTHTHTQTNKHTQTHTHTPARPTTGGQY